MNSLSDPFIKRPVMTMLVYLTVSAFGIYSYIMMPVSDLPTVDYPVIQVTASYPGANPEVMASNVAAPLEQQFLQIPGIDIVTSNNSQGNSKMVLQFQLDKSIDGAASDVQAAINRAQGSLPADLPSPPTFQKSNPNDFPVIFLGVISYSMTAGQLYDYAFTEIAQRLQTVPGVASVNTYGSPRAVRIRVDPHKLYSRGLTFDDITGAIRGGTSLQSAGQIKGNSIQMTVKPRTQLEHSDDYSKLIIADKDGAPVFLRDVAEVVDSLQSEDMRMQYWSKTIPAGSVGVVLSVTKASGANSVEVAQGVQAMIPKLRQIIPQSMQILPIYDRSVSIRNSIEDVDVTLLIAFVLVVLVVFLFLGRVADTIIPAVALPMSLLLTFIVMHLCGFSLDNLSLMALTLSVGFLIDDAIVFLENMVRRMEAGEHVWTAAFNGAKEISFTILAMTLSLASVFIPLVGMSGLMGRVFRELGVTIIVAVVASGVVSLTLTPMMCSRLLTAHEPHKRSLLERSAHFIEERLLAIYSPMLTFALRHWYLSVAAYALCGFGVYWFALNVQKTFLPEGDSGFVSGAWIVDTDTSPQQMKQYQDRIIEAVSKVDHVLGFVTVSGFTQRNNSNSGSMFIALDDPKNRPPIKDVTNQIKAVMAQIPGVVPSLRPRPVLNISAGATNNNQGKYAYTISGLDKDKVYASGYALMDRMLKSKLFSIVNPDYFPDNRQLEISLDRDQASNYGVGAAGLAQTISNAYSQNYSYLIKNDFQQYWVIVEAAPEYRARPGNLDQIFFNSQTNQGSLYSATAGGEDLSRLVPFRTAAKTNVTLGPLAVNHINGFTSFTLSYDLAPGVGIGTATDFIAQAAAEIVPPELTRGFQGDALIFRQTVVSMGVMFLVAIFVMYVILGILYESYIHPITVLSSLPVAIVGGLGTLWLFDSELSLYAWIGVFMLAGLVKKNGIMMIDFAIARQSEGRTPYEAVHEACLERFRPIMMTTLAAFFGTLPLAIGLGADAASRQPLGLTICGGLVVSQLVTLFVTPVTFLGLEWVQVRILDRIPFFARRHHLHSDAPPLPGLDQKIPTPAV